MEYRSMGLLNLVSIGFSILQPSHTPQRHIAPEVRDEPTNLGPLAN